MIVYDACRLIRERVPDAAQGQRKSTILPYYHVYLIMYVPYLPNVVSHE